MRRNAAQSANAQGGVADSYAISGLDDLGRPGLDLDRLACGRPQHPRSVVRRLVYDAEGASGRDQFRVKSRHRGIAQNQGFERTVELRVGVRPTTQHEPIANHDGLPVEFEFRRIHLSGGRPNYYWKATPLPA